MRIIFWLLSGAYGVAGFFTMAQAVGGYREAGSLGRAYLVLGVLLLMVGVISAGATLLSKKARGWLVVAPLILGAGLLVALFAAFWIDMEKGEVHRRHFEEELHSGRNSFGEQPALLAIAQAIRANDQEAIRTAARAVPDLQIAGHDGATLLCWAVRESWQRPELVDAIETLLSLGADPNYTNGQRASFAMSNAVHASAPVLAAMLKAGGNANAVDEFGRPMILMIWYLGYYPNDQRMRLDLLLGHGADINATMPARESDSAGYTLLLHRLQMSSRDDNAYADALHLLERGADPNRAAADGITFAKMMTEQRSHFETAKTAPPSGFTALWQWAERHGLLVQRE